MLNLNELPKPKDMKPRTDATFHWSSFTAVGNAVAGYLADRIVEDIAAPIKLHVHCTGGGPGSWSDRRAEFC